MPTAYIECPQCQADIRLKRADRHWARCKYCGHEFDPSESSEPVEWRMDD